MLAEDLVLFAFNEDERAILNQHLEDGKINLDLRDMRAYFALKSCDQPMGVTDLVKKCLTERHYDINSERMFNRRKKTSAEASEDDFYDNKSFVGCDEFRVSTFSRSLNKLLKYGLVKKHRVGKANVFETVIKENNNF